MTYQETPYQKTNIVDASGNVINSFGGGGSSSDASAAKQQSQIDLETQIRDRLPNALVSGRLPVDAPLANGAATDITLQQVRDAIKAQIDIASTIWTDNSGSFYVRRDIVNEGLGTIAVIFTDPSGSAAIPGSGLRPLATTDKDTLTDFYDVLANGTGYSVGDLLSRVAILDINSSTPSVAAIWLNLSLGTILSSAPTNYNIERANENIGARQLGTWNLNNIFGTITLPTGAATDLVLGAVRDRLPSTLGAKAAANSLSIAPATDAAFVLGPSSSFIGRSGIRAFRAVANFTRPADTTQYTVNDAITNSTSAPTILTADLSSFGGTAGTFICFTNARVISDIAQTVLPFINVVIFGSTFTVTNDNSQLSIADATAQLGGQIIPCYNTYNFAANSRCVSDPGQWLMQLASTSIFFTLQAANAYIPGSGERFDVILEGFVL
ncbi:MAG: hypothetical protein V7K21_19225 [Nostoc sp.]|uniref:hypothetical protein n=1 Tax=Nostoc sp. TaxID=1180 RepID=UPI002FF8480D